MKWAGLTVMFGLMGCLRHPDDLRIRSIDHGVDQGVDQGTDVSDMGRDDAVIDASPQDGAVDLDMTDAPPDMRVPPVDMAPDTPGDMPTPPPDMPAGEPEPPPGGLQCAFQAVDSEIRINPPGPAVVRLLSTQPPVAFWSAAEGAFHAFFSTLVDETSQPHWMRLTINEGVRGDLHPVCAAACPAGRSCRTYSVVSQPAGGSRLSLFRSGEPDQLEVHAIADPPVAIDCDAPALTTIPYFSSLDHPSHEAISEPFFDANGDQLIAWHDYDPPIPADGDFDCFWQRNDGVAMPTVTAPDARISGRAAMARVAGRNYVAAINIGGDPRQLVVMAMTLDGTDLNAVNIPEGAFLPGTQPEEAELHAVGERLWIVTDTRRDTDWGLRVLRTTPVMANGRFEAGAWDVVKHKDVHVADVQGVRIADAFALVWYDRDPRGDGPGELWFELFDLAGESITRVMHRMEPDCEPVRVHMASNGAVAQEGRFGIVWNCRDRPYFNEVRCAVPAPE